jgi:hypothetical protein
MGMNYEQLKKIKDVLSFTKCIEIENKMDNIEFLFHTCDRGKCFWNITMLKVDGKNVLLPDIAYAMIPGTDMMIAVHNEMSITPGRIDYYEVY